MPQEAHHTQLAQIYLRLVAAALRNLPAAQVTLTADPLASAFRARPDKSASFLEFLAAQPADELAKSRLALIQFLRVGARPGVASVRRKRLVDAACPACACWRCWADIAAVQPAGPPRNGARDEPVDRASHSARPGARRRRPTEPSAASRRR